MWHLLKQADVGGFFQAKCSLTRNKWHRSKQKIDIIGLVKFILQLHDVFLRVTQGKQSINLRLFMLGIQLISLLPLVVSKKLNRKEIWT